MRIVTVIQALIKRQQYVWFKSDTSFTEEMLASCYIGWGAILLWVLPNLLSGNPSYAAMGIFAEQWLWGGVFFITGMLKLVGAALHDVWDSPHVRTLRAVGALFGTFIWTFIAVMFSRGASVGTGAVVYTVFAMSCILTMQRYISWGWARRYAACLWGWVKTRRRKNAQVGPHE